MPHQDDMAEPRAWELLEAVNEPVYVLDLDRKITYWNPAAERLTGFSAAQVVGRRCRDDILNHVDETGKQLCGSCCPLAETVRDGQPREAAVFLRHRDGHRVPVLVRTGVLHGPDGEITGGVEVFHDDSERLALAERLSQVERQALTDELTGVANRRMLERVLHQCQEEGRRYGQPYAVVFADIDHFKDFNDQYGHNVGDETLQLVAATLQGCIRSGDTAGRWGGEEFLIVARAAGEESAVRLADRARRRVAGAWTTRGDQRVRATVSVGVAVAHQGEPAVGVVDRADRAMLAAKERGRNQTAIA